MSVWRTLPEFPNYEITEDGDVRNRSSKKKLNEVENKKTGAWSYSLRRNDGRSTCRNYEGLIYSAWPELKPEEKAPEPPKPKVKRQTRKPEDWADIPNFPRYQISKDGKLRYKSNKQLIHPKERRVTLTTSYSVDELMQSVFGEAA